MEALETRGGVVLRYCDAQGQVGAEDAPNGAMNAIAGIVNERGTVLGMMPHPERAVEKLLGNEDGLGIFRSLASAFVRA